MPRDSELDRRSITVLAAGHCCVDICQGAIPALMPFMVIRRGYSYSEATALLLVMTFASSMLQPIFGHASDRRSLAWLLPGGILLGGIGLAVVGLTASFGLTLAAVFLSGLGVGAYHPEGARFANFVAGERRATGMSLYAVGGNIGFALGPVVVTALVLPLGIGGLAWIGIPMAIAAALLASELPRLKRFADPGAEATGAPSGETGDRWLPFSGVAAIAGFRSATYFALQAFVPLWFIQHLDESAAVGNGALAALLLAGAIGTLIGGRAADRAGRRLVIKVSMGLTTPLILAFLLVGPIPAIIVLAATGFFMIGTFSITVVLGQEYLPNRIGLASGVTLGAAIGFGGLVAWLLGLVADQTGLLTVLLITAAMPLPAFLFATVLPAPNR
ncbi:MAG: MFS transporter [Solirubrobacterales bacterium]|nr:MFS transporter [Solirubrobacterales bacterium]